MIPVTITRLPASPVPLAWELRLLHCHTAPKRESWYACNEDGYVWILSPEICACSGSLVSLPPALPDTDTHIDASLISISFGSQLALPTSLHSFSPVGLSKMESDELMLLPISLGSPKVKQPLVQGFSLYSTCSPILLGVLVPPSSFANGFLFFPSRFWLPFPGFFHHTLHSYPRGLLFQFFHFLIDGWLLS